MRNTIAALALLVLGCTNAAPLEPVCLGGGILACHDSAATSPEMEYLLDRAGCDEGAAGCCREGYTGCVVGEPVCANHATLSAVGFPFCEPDE